MQTRRGFTAAAAFTGLAILAAPVLAQEFPSRPVRWIVPYTPGGGSDVTARLVADAMKQGLGQPIVIENRPGAGTIVGMQALLSAPADGLTIATVDTGTLAFNPSLYEKLPYKADTSFVLIGGLGRVPLVLVGRPELPQNTLQELIAYARQNPGKLTYGSAGAGSPHHVAMEMFQQQTGLRLVHVPYKGAAPAIQDLLGGQIDLAMLDAPGAMAFLKAGKLKPLSTSMPKRAAQLPNVPTMAEAGVPDFVAYGWQGVVAPAGTPANAVRKLDVELRRALESPEVRSRLDELAVEPMPMTAEQFAAYVKGEQTRWARVIKTAGIRLE